MSASRQLPLPFCGTPEYSDADFLDAPGNVEARAWLARPAEWPAGRLALWGEAGVGKSHLLHVWARRVGAAVLSGALRGAPVQAVPVGPPGGPLERIALEGNREAIPSDNGERVNPLGKPKESMFSHPEHALALDDADLFGPEPALLHLLNGAAESGVPLLMAARSPPARWPVRLADLASRLAAVAAVEVRPLDEVLLGALFARLLAQRQLVLGPSLAAFLLARLPRHPSALAEAAARLDRAGLAAGGPVTRSLALAALASLIGPEPDADDEKLVVSPPARPFL